MRTRFQQPRSECRSGSIRKATRQKSRMVETSSSGSGEGPGRQRPGLLDRGPARRRDPLHPSQGRTHGAWLETRGRTSRGRGGGGARQRDDPRAADLRLVAAVSCAKGVARRIHTPPAATEGERSSDRGVGPTSSSCAAVGTAAVERGGRENAGHVVESSRTPRRSAYLSGAVAGQRGHLGPSWGRGHAMALPRLCRCRARIRLPVRRKARNGGERRQAGRTDRAAPRIRRSCVDRG